MDAWIAVPHEILVSLHSIGLSWAVVIPTAALLARALIFPTITLPLRRVMQRRLELVPLISAFAPSLRNTMEKAPKEGVYKKAPDVLFKNRMLAARKHLQKDFKCGWWYNWITVLQLPVFLAITEAIRSMIGMQRGLMGALLDRIGWSSTGSVLEQDSASPRLYNPEWYEPSMAVEGLPWMLDLTAADPSLTLPFVVSGLMIANLAFTGPKVTKELPQSLMQRRMTRSLLLVGLAIGPLTLELPAGILYYWACSSASALASNILLDRMYPLRSPVRACARPLRAENLEPEKTK
jgi:inner membrane protein COX18